MLTLKIWIKSCVFCVRSGTIHYFQSSRFILTDLFSLNDRRPGLHKFQKIEKQFVKHLVWSRHLT